MKEDRGAGSEEEGQGGFKRAMSLSFMDCVLAAGNDACVQEHTDSMLGRGRIDPNSRDGW